MNISIFNRLQGAAGRFLTGVLLMIILSAIAPQKMEAQWTVFDPSTYAEVGAVWSQDVSTGVKIAEEVKQMTSLLTQTVEIYNLAKTEASFLEKGKILQAVGFAAVHATIPGHPDWDRAMMTAGGLAAAGTTWQNMTNPGMSLQNRIAMVNSFAASSLNSLGSCNSAAMQNGAALGGLQSLVLSMSGSANTAGSLGVINNMTQAQALRYQQCQENLQEQRLKLDLIRLHESLDRDQYTVNTNAAVDTYNSSGGGEWDITPENDYRLAGMH